MQVYIFLPTKRLILFSFFFFLSQQICHFIAKFYAAKYYPNLSFQLYDAICGFGHPGGDENEKDEHDVPREIIDIKTKVEEQETKWVVFFFCLVFNPLEASEKKSEWTYQHTPKLSQFLIK